MILRKPWPVSKDTASLLPYIAKSWGEELDRVQNSCSCTNPQIAVNYAGEDSSNQTNPRKSRGQRPEAPEIHGGDLG